MKRLLIVSAMCVGLAGYLLAESGEKDRERIKASGQVLHELAGTPEGIPQDLLDKSKCVIVLPSVKKAAIGIGGTYGKGVMTCRSGTDFTGNKWGPPVMMSSTGGSFGLQLGGEATDFVVLVMNEGGAHSLLKNSKVKLGADASVAAGPVGRTAEASTNARMNAEMLSYSRSKGAFAGISLDGATLMTDGDANKAVYGDNVTPEQIASGSNVATPPEASQLLATLGQHSKKTKEAAK